MITLETGDTGRAITAASDGALYAGLTGTDSYVLDVGNKLKADAQSNNKVRLMDGEIMLQGRHVRLINTETVTIKNGMQGQKRCDLIVCRYTKSGPSEQVQLLVLNGSYSTSTPVPPSIKMGDILKGSTTVDMPLYQVYLDGINITKVLPVFTVLDTLSALQEITADYRALKRRIPQCLRVLSYVYNGTGKDYVQLYTLSDVKSLLRYAGLSEETPRECIQFVVSNGDYEANATHVTSIDYSSAVQAWYAYFNTNVSGNIRLNVMVLYAPPGIEEA